MPPNHRSDALRGFHERLSKEDWVGTVVYLKHGFLAKVAESMVVPGSSGDAAAGTETPGAGSSDVASSGGKPMLMSIKARKTL